jgi:hypothetical protein
VRLHHDVVLWRPERARPEDVVELLEGLGRMLMEIGAKLDDIIELLEERA